MWIKKSWENSKNAYSQGLHTTRGWIFLITSVVLFVVLLQSAFSSSIQLGLSFLFTGSWAIYCGYNFKLKGCALIVVYLGVIIAMVARDTMFSAKDSWSSGDNIGAIIVFLVGFYLVLWSMRLKKGDID